VAAELGIMSSLAQGVAQYPGEQLGPQLYFLLLVLGMACQIALFARVCLEVEELQSQSIASNY
jgi:hypothetical protein